MSAAHQVRAGMRIGGSAVVGDGPVVLGRAAATGEPLLPGIGSATTADVDAAVGAATAAAAQYRACPPSRRAALLTAIAAALGAGAEQIVDRAVLETGLSETRIRGELARTRGQLTLFADALAAGSIGEVRIDPARTGSSARPDIRQMQVPVGPVAVFGASNFPLAFSNAGGDTASALAAGCPVIVKSHNAHPVTAALVAAAIDDAVREVGLPPGVHSALVDDDTAIGAALVTHPGVRSVAFTGSRAGGLALQALAARRTVPIPVHAEMSSVNPVCVLPGAAAPELAEGFVASLTLGSGQFCTNPGMVLVPAGDAGDAFVRATATLVGASTGTVMLTRTIAETYRRQVADLTTDPDVEQVSHGPDGEGPNAPGPAAFGVSARTALARPELLEEVFGPAAVLVRYRDRAELSALLAALEGQLTVTVHAGPADLDEAAALLPQLELLAGRLIWNGWPTGVEVGHAMVHGGPFPATTDARTTSVGSAAVHRFLRPVAYQGFPAALLPAALQQDNPWRLERRLDGRPEHGQTAQP